MTTTYWPYVIEEIAVSLTELGPCDICTRPITTYWRVSRCLSTEDRGRSVSTNYCTRCATSLGHGHLAIWCEAMQDIDRAMQAAPDQAARDDLVALTKGAVEHFAVWRKADDPDVLGQLEQED